MKKSTIILIWGLVTGIASAIFYQILEATGQENSQLRWVNALILFLGIFIGTMKLRDKANGGYLTFGEGFKTGFFMVLIITVVGVISALVDMQLHPDFIDKIIEQSRDNMINKGMTEDQIEMGIKYVKIYTTPTWIVLWVVIADLVLGTILSLISAGLCSRKKPIFDDLNEMPAGDNTPQA